MTYTFKTRPQLLQHLRALCELSGSIEHSKLPISDFEHDLPELQNDLLLINKLSKKFSSSPKMYIAFRTTGFESSTIFHHFKSRVSSFNTSVISCYTISFADGFYILKQFEL